MKNTANLIDLRFPIGDFIKKDNYSADEIASLADDIENAPVAYKKLAKTLSANDLSKTYRPGSWNVQQLFHHVADIQLLHFFRMKKALTESDYKVVTLIDMNAWVNTKDGVIAPIEDSLIMLEGITKRYVCLIRSLTEEELKIAYYHPIRVFDISQMQAIAMSAWHLNHHMAHINVALEQVITGS
jgi:hypothetical protein